eukprot:jgi/Orpsp1_1/1192522/evm.model.d7180000093953.1
MLSNTNIGNYKNQINDESIVNAYQEPMMPSFQEQHQQQQVQLQQPQPQNQFSMNINSISPTTLSDTYFINEKLNSINYGSDGGGGSYNNSNINNNINNNNSTIIKDAIKINENVNSSLTKEIEMNLICGE